MPHPPPGGSEIHLAFETLYRFLAAAISGPDLPCEELLCDPAAQRLACAAADLLREEFAAQAIPLGFGELPADDLSLAPAVAQLAGDRQNRCAEYIRVFSFSVCRECPPYETEYHKADEVFFRSQQMADVAGFYRAFGLTPGGAAHERPDHLALELEFVACLLAKQRLAAGSGAAEQAEVCARARAEFVRHHLCWWVPSFALALRRKAERGFYAEIGRVLAALMPIERRRLGVAPPILPIQASLIESPDECSGCLVSLAD